MARKKGFVSEINVTPFVDVMMVLLIIFMVTAPMMDSGLDVDLPQAKQVDTLPSDSEHLVLTVREDGSLYLDTSEVPLEELAERLVTRALPAGRQGRALWSGGGCHGPHQGRGHREAGRGRHALHGKRCPCAVRQRPAAPPLDGNYILPCE